MSKVKCPHCEEDITQLLELLGMNQTQLLNYICMELGLDPNSENPLRDIAIEVFKGNVGRFAEVKETPKVEKPTAGGLSSAPWSRVGSESKITIYQEVVDHIVEIIGEDDLTEEKVRPLLEAMYTEETIGHEVAHNVMTRTVRAYIRWIENEVYKPKKTIETTLPIEQHSEIEPFDGEIKKQESQAHQVKGIDKWDAIANYDGGSVKGVVYRQVVLQIYKEVGTLAYRLDRVESAIMHSYTLVGESLKSREATNLSSVYDSWFREKDLLDGFHLQPLTGELRKVVVEGKLE